MRQKKKVVCSLVNRNLRTTIYWYRECNYFGRMIGICKKNQFQPTKPLFNVKLLCIPWQLEKVKIYVDILFVTSLDYFCIATLISPFCIFQNFGKICYNVVKFVIGSVKIWCLLKIFLSYALSLWPLKVLYILGESGSP